MAKEKAIIVDIDGTLADCSHRRHHVEGEKKDWDAFFAGIADDKPNDWCVELVSRFHDDGFADLITVILVTGRFEKYDDVTRKWLEKHYCYYSYEYLFMRKDGDYRQDAIVKEEIYKRDIEPHFDVLFAVDDRKQVVDMWRRNGVVCLQCTEGDF